MTEQMIRTAFAGMRPLPGAEERIWEEIDKKLRRRGSTLFVQYGKRRDPLPALLTAALVLALTLLTVLLLRRTPVERGEDTLSIAPIGETEIAPIVGTKEQAEDLIGFITNSGAGETMWETNIFGKSVEQMVNDGIQSKIAMIGPQSQEKLQDCMKKIVNEANGGMVCIII